MNKTRTHLAVIAMVASLSLLAACSKGEDNKVGSTSSTTSPAVVTPPAPVISEPAPAPVPEAAPAPATSTTTDKVEELKQSAKEAADKVTDKAVELKNDAGDIAKRAGDAIKEGAATADKAIQDKLGNGTATDKPVVPALPNS